MIGRRTRLLGAPLVVAVLLSTAACGSGASGGSKNGIPSTIKVGVPLDLTGDAGIVGVGTGELRGIKLAAKEIEASGFLGKSKIDLVVSDTKTDKTAAAAAVLKMVKQDDVSAIVGFTLSTEFNAAGPTAQRSKIPIVAPALGSGLDAVGDYAFGIYPNLPEVYPAQDVKFVDAFGAKTAAYLYDSDNPTATAITEARQSALEKAGVKTVTSQQIGSADTDFRAQLTKIKQAKPDVILTSVLPGQYPAIFLQLKQLQVPGQVIASDGVVSPQALEQAGSAMQCTVYTAAWAAQNDEGRNADFQKQFKASYPDQQPDSWTASGYDALWLWATAVKTAGSVDGPAVQKALASTQNFDGAFGVYGVTPDRATTIKGTPLIIDNSATKPWTPTTTCER